MYEKKVAELYDEVINAGYHDQKTYISELLKIIPKKSSVLEIGCGTGLTLIPLLQNNINIEGIDNSKAMLKKLKEKHNNAKVFFADVRNFKSAKEYDYVLSCNGPFSIKKEELESYILEKDEIVKIIKKYSKMAKNGLLINKGKEKDSLALELKNDGQFIHREIKQGDYIIMTNLLFNKNIFVAKKDFIKRRYPLKEILKGVKIKKDLGKFLLIKF